MERARARAGRGRGAPAPRPAASGRSAQNGWVQITGSPRQPAAFALFSYRTGSVTVTSASVAAIRTGAAFRMFIERAGQSVQSGLAIANPSANPAVVNFEVTNLDGQTVGLTGSVTIGPARQVSLFVNEIPGLQSIPSQFRGVLKITSPSGGLAVTGLRGRINERGEFLITTLRPARVVRAYRKSYFVGDVFGREVSL